MHNQILKLLKTLANSTISERYLKYIREGNIRINDSVLKYLQTRELNLNREA